MAKFRELWQKCLSPSSREYGLLPSSISVMILFQYRYSCKVLIGENASAVFYNLAQAAS